MNNPDEHLRERILAAFNHPTLSDFREICSGHLDAIKRDSSRYIGINEEEDLVLSFLESDNFDYLTRTITVGALRPEIGYGLLPLLMTVDTTNPWRMGRGVLESSLYIFNSRRGALVDQVIRFADSAQKAVICDYIRFCAANGGDMAQKSLRLFWQSQCDASSLS